MLAFSLSLRAPSLSDIRIDRSRLTLKTWLGICGSWCPFRGLLKRFSNHVAGGSINLRISSDQLRRGTLPAIRPGNGIEKANGGAGGRPLPRA